MQTLKRLIVRPQALPEHDPRLPADSRVFSPEDGIAGISKQELAARLGISRTTLWRRIKALEERGRGLQSETHKVKHN